MGWGRVYSYERFDHIWLVKPAPTKWDIYKANWYYFKTKKYQNYLIFCSIMCQYSRFTFNQISHGIYSPEVLKIEVFVLDS